MRPRRNKDRSEEHTSELQSQFHLVCRLLLEKKNTTVIPAALLSINVVFTTNITLAIADDNYGAQLNPCAVPNEIVGSLEETAFFFFNDTTPTDIYTLSLHDALPILPPRLRLRRGARDQHRSPRGVHRGGS